MQNDPNNPQRPSGRPPGVPSRRAVGALVAGALGIGLLAGASLAPAPPSSLASSSTVVTRLLALLAADGGARSAAAAYPAPTPAVAATPAAGTDASKTRTGADAGAEGASSSSTEAGPSAPGENASSEGAPSKGGKSPSEHKAVRLPPISHVWLVVLDAPGLTQAVSDPTGYPYLTGQLLKAGTQLERYSAIEAYELAGDAALLTGGVGESLSTISQPCAATSGAPSVGSATGIPASSAPGACRGPAAADGQSEADAFLQRAVAPILASSAYGERGLVAIAFGGAAQEPGPPALSETTLASSPASGALLLSPTLKAAGHDSEAFDSLAPRQSLETIFAAS